MEGMPLADIRDRAWRSRFLFLFMRLLPWAATRNIITPAVAAAIRNRHPVKASSPSAGELAVNAVLRDEGLAVIPPVLTGPQIDEMLAFLRQEELVAKNGQRFRLDLAPDTVRTGSYPLDSVLRCPHVLDLINQPALIRMASDYLGCIPTISGLRIDWSAPSNGDPTFVQQFHRDHDDWRFVKLFVYLTDVDAGAGPHEFVKTSHRTSGRISRRPYEEGEVERQYGKNRMFRVEGKKGTSFLADTWGIHKGNVPSTRPRLMLQVQYSLLPVWKYAYHPVAMPLQPDFPHYVNRLIVSPGGSPDKQASTPEDAGERGARPAGACDLGGAIPG